MNHFSKGEGVLGGLHGSLSVVHGITKLLWGLNRPRVNCDVAGERHS